MAIWENRVVYQYGDRFWENVWHIDIGADTDVDPDLTAALVTFALNTLLSIYSVARVARRPVGTADAFIDVIVDAPGAVPIGSNIPAPLFNVIRLFMLAGVGRPGLKLLRGALVVADIIDTQNHISSTLRTLIENEAITLFNAASTAAQSFTVGASAKHAVSPDVSNLVAMRQLHRKRKKVV